MAEEVTEENIDRMRELVIRGSPSKPKFSQHTQEEIDHHYPGAGAFEIFGPGKKVSRLDEDAFDVFEVGYSNSWFLKERYPDDPSKRIENVYEEELQPWYQERRRLRRIHGDDEESFKNALDAFTIQFKRGFARAERSKAAERLKPGDIVHRHLVKGAHDSLYSCSCPSPSERHGRESHPNEAKGILLQILLFVFPCNADYDGDTMRCFVPQSKEAIEEAKEIMGVNKQIIHSRYGRPIIASDQMKPLVRTFALLTLT